MEAPKSVTGPNERETAARIAKPITITTAAVAAAGLAALASRHGPSAVIYIPSVPGGTFLAVPLYLVQLSVGRAMRYLTQGIPTRALVAVTGASAALAMGGYGIMRLGRNQK